MLHAGVVVCDVVVIVVKTNEIVEYCPLIRGYRYREGTVQQIGGARWWKRDGERRSEVLNLSISRSRAFVGVVIRFASSCRCSALPRMRWVLRRHLGYS